MKKYNKKGSRLHITCSGNGWDNATTLRLGMRRHLPVYDDGNEFFRLGDQWTVWTEDWFLDRLISEHNTLCLHIPSKLTGALNPADLYLHGVLRKAFKHVHGMWRRSDAAKDKTRAGWGRSPDYEQICQWWDDIMKELIEGSHNTDSKHIQEQSKKPWFWSGYGLPWDGSKDAMFLEHLCGKRVDHTIPAAFFGEYKRVDKMTCREVLDMERATGPKYSQTGAPSVAVLPCDVQAIQEKMHADAELTSNIHMDTRVTWIKRVRENAQRVGGPVRDMGLPFFGAVAAVRKAWCAQFENGDRYFIPRCYVCCVLCVVCVCVCVCAYYSS